jgi:Leucine-rich repeat (LRR) protein
MSSTTPSSSSYVTEVVETASNNSRTRDLFEDVLALDILESSCSWTKLIDDAKLGKRPFVREQHLQHLTKMSQLRTKMSQVRTNMNKYFSTKMCPTSSFPRAHSDENIAVWNPVSECLQFKDAIRIQIYPKSKLNKTMIQQIQIKENDGSDDIIDEVAIVQLNNNEDFQDFQDFITLVSKIKVLKILKLEECYELKSLPKGFGDLINLKELYMSDCVALQSLPERFGDLVNLQTLKLENCRELKSLPERFGDLKNLKELNMYRCMALQSLPERFGELKSLTSLNLRECFKLESLPERFGDLERLETLNLESCYKLESLPERFGELKNLKELSMGGCPAKQSMSPSILNKLQEQGCKIKVNSYD